MRTLSVALRCLLVLPAFTAGAFSVAACQGDGEPRDAAAGFMAGAPDYGLHFVDGGDTAKLAYGQENSELMSLMLECAKGSGEVEISDVAHGSGEISLASDGKSAAFDGAVTPAPMAPVLIADARADAPVLQAFRRTGKVEVVNGKLRYGIDAGPTERPGVEQFFAACERTV